MRPRCTGDAPREPSAPRGGSASGLVGHTRGSYMCHLCSASHGTAHRSPPGTPGPAKGAVQPHQSQQWGGELDRGCSGPSFRPVVLESPGSFQSPRAQPSTPHLGGCGLTSLGGSRCTESVKLYPSGCEVHQGWGHWSKFSSFSD